jgi:hypothetical protein
MLCSISGIWNWALSAASVMSQTAAMAQPKPSGIAGRPTARGGAPDAEIVAGAAQHDDARALGSAQQQLGQLLRHIVAGRVAVLRPIQGDLKNRALLFG